MSTYRFQKVSHQAKRSGPCPVCGKKVRRTRVFRQTVNPFNKNADGSVKTFMEVLASVQVEAALWEPDFTHEGCAS